MIRTLLLSAAFVAVASTSAFSDIRSYTVEYHEPETLSAQENPIKLNIEGWGDDWARNINIARGKKDEHRNVYNVSSEINKSGYSGYLLFGETIHGHFYSDDTLRNRIQRIPFFNRHEIVFGDYGTVSNGSAEYKYMTLQLKSDKPTFSCVYMTANWRNFVSIGILCADSRVPMITEQTARNFIKSIGFKNELSPTSTGALPGPMAHQG